MKFGSCQSVTDAGNGGAASLDGSGAAEEDEARAVGFGGGNGGEGVAAARPRRVLVGVPAGLHRAISRRRNQPWLGTHSHGRRSQRSIDAQAQTNKQQIRVLGFGKYEGGGGRRRRGVAKVVQGGCIDPTL